MLEDVHTGIREKNMLLYEIDHPTYQGVIMADQNITPEPVTTIIVTEEKVSRFKSFKTNHPRVAKALGITAVVAATMATCTVVKNLRSDNDSRPVLENSFEGEILSTPETTQVAEA